MSKVGLPYLPCTLVWTKKVWTNILLSTLPTSPKSLDILEKNFATKFISSWNILGYNEDIYYQGGLKIKALVITYDFNNENPS